VRRALPWWCVALLAACGDPTVPSRADSYAFDAGGDVFHWPANRLPVRVYAQPVGNLGFLVQRAIDVWASGFLYGEFTGALAGDSTKADVVVEADSAPDVPPDQGRWVAACGGVTTFPPRDASNRLTGAPHVRLSVLTGYTAAQVAACLRRTAIHELGHALGILQEAPAADTLEIMHSPPQVALPSDRDRRTMEVLYHTPATILPPP
jgi:predicted Zn-dependent protease